MKSPTRIVILYGCVAENAEPDELDVLIEARHVTAALTTLGYDTVSLPLTLDLERAARRLKQLAPRAVFNLVESINGEDRFLHLAATLLDSLGIPYTGTGESGMYLASNKTLAKRLMTRAGIATPEWCSAKTAEQQGTGFDPPYLVKSVWNNGSRDLQQPFDSEDCLRRHLAARGRSGLRDDIYVESYIEGREFNLSLVQNGTEVVVLPPAEMMFVGYPPGKARILNYESKWIPESFEYTHTVRRFDFGPQDQELLERLSAIARRCWRVLDIGGYGRVDFRTDAHGMPLVLEVNPNPCLSPDAGLVAAASRAGWSYNELVRRIVKPALKQAAGTKPVPQTGSLPAAVAAGSEACAY